MGSIYLCNFGKPIEQSTASLQLSNSLSKQAISYNSMY